MSDRNSLLYRLEVMCGRFTLKSPGRIKFDALTRKHLPPLFPRYNIAPTQNVLAIVQGGEAALLQWGLIPSWSKEAKGSINARSETIEVKPSFGESFQRRGALMAANILNSERAVETSVEDCEKPQRGTIHEVTRNFTKSGERI